VLALVLFSIYRRVFSLLKLLLKFLKALFALNRRQSALLHEGLPF